MLLAEAACRLVLRSIASAPKSVRARKISDLAPKCFFNNAPAKSFDVNLLFPPISRATSKADADGTVVYPLPAAIQRKPAATPPSSGTIECERSRSVRNRFYDGTAPPGTLDFHLKRRRRRGLRFVSSFHFLVWFSRYVLMIMRGRGVML
jgi:hypothetical protein